jgi:UDP-glucose 4-epimerase
MTKALQERVFIGANLGCPTRFICGRYGNVLASRGSVVPLFHDQIRKGGPVTITDRTMTRFLLSLDSAVDVVFTALREASPGEIYVPRIPSALVTDIADVLIGPRKISVVETGIRPGEKLHEIMVSEEECPRTYARGKYFVIRPALPELREGRDEGSPLRTEYSSANEVLSRDKVQELLRSNRLMLEQTGAEKEGELLR